MEDFSGDILPLRHCPSQDMGQIKLLLVLSILLATGPCLQGKSILRQHVGGYHTAMYANSAF